MTSINRVTRTNEPDSTNGRIILNATYLGFVKNNVDPQTMGRLAVYIPEIGGDPANPEDWIVVGYASHFAGSSSPRNLKKGDKSMAGSQTSYGWWGVPPDLENEVLVTFVNGDVARGFWFACVWQQNMNQMVPGIANARTDDPDHKQGAPTVEYNKIDTDNPNDPNRPVFTPLATGLSSQGLATDPARGPATSSARREGVAKVYGMLTPRGNQFYVDDNPDNEFIRIRTRSGAQILVNETNGCVYINSKLGNAWMEISDEGVDIYSKNSVSIRAEGDFNVRADKNILFDAGGSIFMRAGSDLNIQTGGKIIGGAAGDLILSTDGKGFLTTAGDFRTSTGGSIRSQSGADISVKSGGTLNLQSSGGMSSLAGGTIIRQAPSIQDNPGSAPSAADVAANPASVPVPQSAPDVQGGKATKIKTIVNRLPTHEPWGGHPSLPKSSGKGSGGGSSSGSSGSGSGSSSAGSQTGGAATTSGTSAGAGVVAPNAKALVAKYVGGPEIRGGQCVALVQDATGLGNARNTWKQGDTITPENVGSIPAGTAVATFQNGVYQSNPSGNHAALLLGPGTAANGQPGMQVLEQYKGQPPMVKVYPFGGYGGKFINNAGNYSIVTK